jgi:predicted nucleotidyltransferase component of viral defense system
MLSLQTIKEYYPKELWAFERFMVREYLQYKILEIIFDGTLARHFSFMGGTALRIIYGNNRFSEDLDFDNLSVSEKDFETLTGEIKRKLTLQGFEVEVKSIFKNAFHCHVRFINLLNELGLGGNPDEKIFIRLDTEPQYFDYKQKWKIINKFDVFTEVAVVPQDILLAQKFYAILNRPRNKGRDFYDVVFLLGKNVKPNFKYLQQKSGIKNQSDLMKKMKEKLSTINLKDMAKDVSPFLFYSNEVKKVLLFDKYISAIEL